MALIAVSSMRGTVPRMSAVRPSSMLRATCRRPLTAILLVFGRLSADNELVSLRMTGMSMKRICAPIFVLALLLSGVVDGAVRGVASGTDRLSRLLKPMQSGLLRTYAAGFAVGAVLLAVFVITRMSF